ncbi:MAG TPA: TonB-dependent receptor [Ferruginibacter sp.]|nr:TonB-dependent receptor [Chitinophagales bacterium]HNO99661.1 TonB-dependent receptor [Ferruginibacter sp.]
MKKLSLIIATLCTATMINAQNKLTNDTSWYSKDLSEVVVTGQYKPQTVKKSVYQVRIINSERIKLSGATTVQQVLNNQVGFRFSNDNTLGTTDVQLMGMSGRNVKILLDGVPMVDRGDTRESLNQVDINSIERIEIVEGPMSVIFGSDALAGVINIITKKHVKDDLSVSANIQEETAGTEYHPFNYKGVHMQNLNLAYKKSNWTLSVGGTHNDFDGYGGDAYGRNKSWKPREQWLGNARIGYSNSRLNIYYRTDLLNEDIRSRGAINYNNYKAIDQQYITDRFSQQVQGSYNFSKKLQLASVLSYTDYKRRTKTTLHDFEKGTDVLTSGPGEQDISKFNSFVFRSSVLYQVSGMVSIQPGIDINREQASGERIDGKPVIADYAAFVSAEIKPTAAINIRPGLRFVKNSVYDAPPVIPSINSKFVISKNLDLRLAYAYGFRAPALRELYFNFVDVNHNIVGNPNLKAEYSNSFTGSLNWVATPRKSIAYSASLGGFYNDFNNQIGFAQSSVNSQQYTYFNVNRAKTAGVILENKATWKQLEGTVGFSYIGFYREMYDDKDYIKLDGNKYLWSPELSASVSYTVKPIQTKLNLFYKYTGRRPQYVTGTSTSGQSVLYVAETAAYNLADFTFNTVLNKYITVSGGVKNIFDVNNVNTNAASSSGSIHNAGSSIAINYGRSYFIGLNLHWNRKQK